MAKEPKLKSKEEMESFLQLNRLTRKQKKKAMKLINSKMLKKMLKGMGVDPTGDNIKKAKEMILDDTDAKKSEG